MKNTIIDIKSYKQDVEAKQRNNEELANEQLKTAQANGYVELQQYEKLVKKFMHDVRGLSLFQKIMDDIVQEQVRFYLIDEILNSLVRPVFEGNKPPLMKATDYNEMRKDMYVNLIRRYVDQDDYHNRPF